MRDYFEAEHRAHQLWASESAEDVGPFVLPLAPDRLHKDNASGGPPYGIIAPDGCVDAIFAAEVTMPFVSYLNNGGFPGCSASPRHGRSVRRSPRTFYPSGPLSLARRSGADA